MKTESKRILLITPVPTHPQSAGNRARIFNLAQSIKQLGHDLYLAHVQLETGDGEAMRQFWGGDHFFTIPYTMPRKFGFRLRRKCNRIIMLRPTYTYAVDDWYDDAVSDTLSGLHRRLQFDAVLVEYVFFSRALLCFPAGVVKIIDTHDKFADRHTLYLQNNTAYNWFSTTSAHEKKGLRRADVIMAIQDKERDYFARLTGRQTITVGHSVHLQKMDREPASKAAMLFIGSANQSNIDALRFFIEEIFPAVKTCMPEATLLVAGPVCRVLDISDPGIIKCGEPEQLDELYAKASVVINPIRFGTGLKIKNIEALGYAKPLVTTPVGAEGLEDGINSAFFMAGDASDFSSKVIEILRDPAVCRRLTDSGYAYALQWNRKQSDALQTILNP